MEQLLIRKVEPDLMQWLEDRAKQNGRSVEDEACAIILEALDKEDEEAAAAAPAARAK